MKLNEPRRKLIGGIYKLLKLRDVNRLGEEFLLKLYQHDHCALTCN
jgi:hypothetical protein